MKEVALCPKCGNYFVIDRKSREDIIIEVLKEKKELTASELSRFLGLTHAGTLWRLKPMVDKGVIERVGFHGTKLYKLKGK